jgi:hypothetical protein
VTAAAKSLKGRGRSKGETAGCPFEDPATGCSGKPFAQRMSNPQANVRRVCAAWLCQASNKSRIFRLHMEVQAEGKSGLVFLR